MKQQTKSCVGLALAGSVLVGCGQVPVLPPAGSEAAVQAEAIPDLAPWNDSDLQLVQVVEVPAGSLQAQNLLLVLQRILWVVTAASQVADLASNRGIESANVAANASAMAQKQVSRTANSRTTTYRVEANAQVQVSIQRAKESANYAQAAKKAAAVAQKALVAAQAAVSRKAVQAADEAQRHAKKAAEEAIRLARMAHEAAAKAVDAARKALRR